MSTTSSLHFLSLTPKTLSPISPSSSTFKSLSFFPKSFNASLFSSSCSKLYKAALPLKVAVSSEFGLDEEEDTVTATLSSDLDEEGDVDDRSFSPDLKIFVGNLPFSCDSALLAGLFGRAGTVEMVEVPNLISFFIICAQSLYFSFWACFIFTATSVNLLVFEKIGGFFGFIVCVYIVYMILSYLRLCVCNFHN